jgi:hypothetical protein
MAATLGAAILVALPRAFALPAPRSQSEGA